MRVIDAKCRHWNGFSRLSIWQIVVLCCVIPKFSLKLRAATNRSVAIMCLVVTTVEPPITDPPTSRQPLYNGHWLWHQIEITTELVFNQPPMSGHFLILDSGQAACSQPWPTLYNSASYNGQQETTPCRNLILEESGSELGKNCGK